MPSSHSSNDTNPIAQLSASNQLFAQVVIDTQAPFLAESYTYHIPEAFHAVIQVGSPVLVPFGSRILGGYVVELAGSTEHSEVKDIYQLVESSAFFTPSFLELLKWIADYYGASLASVFHAALPSGIFEKSRRILTLNKSKEEIEQLLPSLPESFREYLRLVSGASLDFNKEIKSGKRALILKMIESGFIRISLELGPPAVRVKTKRWIRLLSDQIEGLTSRQNQILELLKKSGPELPLDRFVELARCTHPTLTKMVEKGALLIFEKEELRDPLRKMEKEADGTFTPTSAQQRAIGALLQVLEQIIEVKGGHAAEDPSALKPNLLFGVTGSGKTEIYLKVIEKALAQGLDALVLVPEISLTPQTISRFRARFGDRIAVLHSHLSSGERFDEWRRIRRGEVKIAIGARSAIFAPFQNLGLIVIDEEHETSFKQNNHPRYDARMVALQRGKLEKTLIIMGSATPRLESFYEAQQGEWSLLELPERVMERQMPPVSIVDMKAELLSGNRSIFSRALKEGLESILLNKEQAILMINRRGFSTFIQCRRCGYVAKCPDCSVSLVYHQDENRIKCHYCNYTEAVPTVCPDCQSSYIRYFGLGTQKVEAEIQKMFPDARIARMDQDTTRTKDAHWKITSSFKKGDTDILIGTQMVAKGFDFPRVSLVGVLSADIALNLPDFAASERTFQLLSQVAGRAGRGELSSQVIIQTYTPEHPSIRSAQNHDYRNFYGKEIEERKILHYPPFSQLINLILSGPREEVVRQGIETLHKGLEDSCREMEKDEEVAILGPAPATHEKLKGLFRYQILIKDQGFSSGRTILKQELKAFNLPSHCRLQVDVDPTDLL